MSDCLFCGIAAGSVAATTVHEDRDIVAFRDINPQAPTHILVIPRVHVASAADLTEENRHLWWHLLHVAQDLAISEGLERQGYRLVTNIGHDGGQTVAHLHLHLLGGRPMGWPPG